IVIRPVILPVSGQRLRRRIVGLIVIARHLVKVNRRIEFTIDARELGDLRLIRRFVGEIARHHYECRMQPVEIRDSKFPVGGLLAEIGVIGEHPELRVARLDKPKRIGRKGQSGRQQQESEPDLHFAGYLFGSLPNGTYCWSSTPSFTSTMRNPEGSVPSGLPTALVVIISTSPSVPYEFLCRCPAKT